MRRSFGTIAKKSPKNRRPYWEARYAPPESAQQELPNLPKYITKTFSLDMRSQAEVWLAEAERAIKLDVWQPPSVEEFQATREKLTFGEYATKWVEGRRKANGQPIARTTREKYEEYLQNHLLPAFGNLPLESVSYRRIRDWWESYEVRRGGYGESGRRHVYTILHAILESAARDPIDDEGTTLLAENPAKLRTTNPKKLKKPVIAEIEELETVRAAMVPGLALAIDLAGDRDMREGEICGLQRQDIDFETKKIHVRHAIKTVKTDQGKRGLIMEGPKSDLGERDIDMTDYIIPRLHEHLDTYVGPEPDAMLFTAPRAGGYLSPQTLRNAWYRARKSVPRLENMGMKFHDLRHTALTRMMEHGATFGLVREQGGHSTDAIAAIYQQVSESKRQEVLHNLNEAHAKASGEKPTEPAGKRSDLITQLKQLSELHTAGVLDDTEFKTAKARLLAS